MSQLSAGTAAEYDGVSEVLYTFSGLLEGTAFNPRVVAAMEQADFIVEKPNGDNPT